MNKIQAAEQLRRAIQMFAATLGEHDAMEVATIYPAWKPGNVYNGGEYVTYGTNAVGDPQLYKVIPGKPHAAQEDWTPDVTASLYTPIGLDDDGYPVWSQPTGAHDAYNVGDIVDYMGVLYESQIDGNVFSPNSDERWWKKVTA